MDTEKLHLDQGESVAFLRQLEEIDTVAYKKRYPALKARSIVKTFASVAAWADLYTWREWDQLGTYAVITDHADDLPSVDVRGAEFSQSIKDLGNSYSYTIKEILKSIATGVPLDAMRAETSRMAIEQGIDDILTTGIPELKIQGVLSLDSTNLPSTSRVGTYTLSTKLAGGVSWGTLAAPNASGQEMANDVIGLCSQIIDDTQAIWDSFDVVMPVAQYNLMRATRVNPLTATTALEFALSDPSVRSITPWTKCKGKGASGTNRMMALPAGDGLVLAGIVPREWTPGTPQLINLAYKVNAYASCGGVISRYPIACRYADGQ